MKKYIFIIIALLLASCSNPQPKFPAFIVKEQNSRYKDSKKEYFVPKEIFSHFPDNVTASYPVGQIFSLDDQHNAYRYFFLICLNNNEKFFKKNERVAKETAIKTFMPADTMQYFVIQPNDFYYKMQDLFFNNIPIPDFRFGKNLVVDKLDSVADSLAFNLYFSNSFSCGLTEDYEIYIIDTQNEYKTFADEYKDIFAALPRTKNTGFSRGICINKKKNILIFWTIIF
jgi:hypothetical protein